MTEKLENLDPSDILIADNVRYGLKPYRVDSLAENILQSGGVRTPVTVEQLKTPIDGLKYRLVVGAYRTAAVSKLNSEQAAGLTIPARVVPELTDSERLLTQVSENTDRENMSPMDKAIAAQKMLHAGVTKLDIRKAFASPGGRKGIKIQPASNAHINMLLSFLDFPKDIQRKIHDGILGMGAAYELTKHPKDKWTTILEKAENERQKQIDKDEKDEENYLSHNKKAEVAEQEAEKLNKELEEAKALAAQTKAVADEKAIATAEALKSRLTAKGEEKKQAEEHFKAAKNEHASAEKVATEAAKELSKLEDKAKSASDKAQAARDRLEAARKAKQEKKDAKGNEKVTGKDVSKAAKAENSPAAKPKKLNQEELRDAIKSIVILSTANKHPKTIAIGNLLQQCADGIITDGQLQLGIARCVGEEKMPAKK